MDGEDTTCYLLDSRLRDTNAEPTDLPLSLLKEITKNFSDKLEIGRGGFGVVYRVGVTNHFLPHSVMSVNPLHLSCTVTHQKKQARILLQKHLYLFLG